MGRPLRTLHQTHSVSPGPDIYKICCNIRTMTRFRIGPLAQELGDTGLVSKNDWLEKAIVK
jgi:hypothetical protein